MCVCVHARAHVHALELLISNSKKKALSKISNLHLFKN